MNCQLSVTNAAKVNVVKAVIAVVVAASARISVCLMAGRENLSVEKIFKEIHR